MHQYSQLEYLEQVSQIDRPAYLSKTWMLPDHLFRVCGQDPGELVCPHLYQISNNAQGD